MNLFSKDTIQRLDKRIASKVEDGDIEVELSPIIKNNLKFLPRPYQEEAFTYCFTWQRVVVKHW